jgi:hypothetical protein
LPSPEILHQFEVARRMRLLTALQETLEQRQIRSIPARHHRLVLYREGLCEPSGLTDPQLHVFGPDNKHVVTINGSAYVLDGGEQFKSPATTAAAIASAARAAAGSCSP